MSLGMSPYCCRCLPLKWLRDDHFIVFFHSYSVQFREYMGELNVQPALLQILSQTFSTSSVYMSTMSCLVLAILKECPSTAALKAYEVLKAYEGLPAYKSVDVAHQMAWQSVAQYCVNCLGSCGYRAICFVFVLPMPGEAIVGAVGSASARTLLKCIKFHAHDAQTDHLCLHVQEKIRAKKALCLSLQLNFSCICSLLQVLLYLLSDSYSTSSSCFSRCFLGCSYASSFCWCSLF